MPKNTNIVIIRHGEKPDDKKNPALSIAGQERAHAYVVYFQNFPSQSSPLKWNYLFATAESPESNRPFLTIQPLSGALGLSIDNSYKNADYPKLAGELLQNGIYDNTNVLICWHHGEILKLAEALGAPAGTLPPKWSGDVFGWVIQLVFDAGGNLTVAPTINQKLMYDDHGKNPPDV
ncbi:MAG TPA: hypothetical protein VK400_18435 [Pyrinomonadaceae bacterium]|nr:hypothetical protein [Pyrinomonadaceae bacterium]